VANEESPFTAFNFRVQLTVPGLPNPVCDSAFAECDGLEMTMEPKTVREGGNNTHQIHLVGRVTYSNLTLKRGMTSSLDLWRWFSGASNRTGLDTPVTGVVLMGDSQPGGDKAKVRFKLYDCLPIKIKAPALNAKEGLLAIEEMQIAYGWFEVELV
jgi:phage tail-like protein